MHLIRSGAVAEQHSNSGAILLWCCVKQSGYPFTLINHYREFFSLHRHLSMLNFYCCLAVFI